MTTDQKLKLFMLYITFQPACSVQGSKLSSIPSPHIVNILAKHTGSFLKDSIVGQVVKTFVSRAADLHLIPAFAMGIFLAKSYQ